MIGSSSNNSVSVFPKFVIVTNLKKYILSPFKSPYITCSTLSPSGKCASASGVFGTKCNSIIPFFSYNLYDEFMSGNSGTLATGAVGIGQINWENTLIGAPTTLAYYYNQTTGNAPPASVNRPGVLDMELGGQGNDVGATMSLGVGSMLLGTSNVIMRTAVNVTGADLTTLVGLDNETSSISAPSTGVYWTEADNGTWQYCYVNSGGTTTCANSSVTATAGSWAILKIDMVSTSEIDFYINGTKYAVTGIAYNTTSPVAPAYTLYKVTGQNKTDDLYVDYFQLTGITTSPR
jgi:hypothetical protein